MKSYLIFNEAPFLGKTKRFNVVSKKHGYALGKIQW